MYTIRKLRKKRTGSKKGIKIVSTLGIFFVLPALIFFTSFFSLGLVTTGVLSNFLSGLPTLEDFPPSDQALTSKIYSADGEHLFDLHDEQNRELVSLEMMPSQLKNAVISIEDERFEEHPGYDIRAIGRAFVSNMMSGGIVEGASTITQQLITSSYMPHSKNIVTYERKINETYLAYELEKIYSKNEILEKYLNAIYFGEGAYGVKVAARTYFDKDITELSISESAVLAGLIQAPNRFSPYQDIKACRQRRDLVLEKMLELGHIDQEEYNQAVNDPIITRRPEETEEEVFAPYFVEYVKQELLRKYGKQKVFEGGLHVYTTLDRKMQVAAENAINNILTDPDDPSAALVAMDPRTGYIKAMVGGKDFDDVKFNLAAQGKRQPGSTFKIFVLAAAIEDGYSPDMTFNPNGTAIFDMPGGDPWEVENYMGTNYGTPEMTIFDATVKSVNVVYSHLIMKVGPEKISQIASNLGIQSHLENYPAIGLGGLTIGVSPLEVCTAFSTIANYGHRNEPTAILKITDNAGNIVYENEPLNIEVISSINAYRIIEIMEQAVQRGTGTRAKMDGYSIAGKTGTTDHGENAWFTGFTPNLTASVWIGYPDVNVRMGTLHGQRVQGGTIPTMIWREFMEEAVKDLPVEKFVMPSDDLIKLRVVDINGKIYLASRNTPEDKIILKEFHYGEEPQIFDSRHKATDRMPGVTSLPREKAQGILSTYGFTNVEFIVEDSGHVAPGYTYRQEPQAGQIVNESTLIRVWVRPGVAPAEEQVNQSQEEQVQQQAAPEKISAVPGIINLPWDQANHLLVYHGFNNIDYIYERNDGVPPNHVYRQEPSGGQSANTNQRIRVWVNP
jgi:penicillin-binding protein 1A